MFVSAVSSRESRKIDVIGILLEKNAFIRFDFGHQCLSRKTTEKEREKKEAKNANGTNRHRGGNMCRHVTQHACNNDVIDNDVMLYAYSRTYTKRRTNMTA